MYDTSHLHCLHPKFNLEEINFTYEWSFTFKIIV